jgi:hypothetical protein
MVMAEVQRLALLKVCKCGHIRREHEKMGEIVPCLHFTKRNDGSGHNAKVCACRDFKELQLPSTS